MPGKVATPKSSSPNPITPKQPKRSQSNSGTSSTPLFPEPDYDDETNLVVSHVNAHPHSKNPDRPNSKPTDDRSARPRRVRIADSSYDNFTYHDNITSREEDEEMAKNLTEKSAVHPDDDPFTPKRRFPIISSLCIMTSCFFAALLIDAAAVFATTQFAGTVLLVGGFSAIPFVGQITLAVAPFVIGAVILLNRKYNIVDYFLTKTDLGKKIADSKVYKWVANTWIGKFITWASYKPIVPFASPEADTSDLLISPHTYR